MEWPMLCLAATEVVSGVSGETEEKLRNLFNRAKVIYCITILSCQASLNRSVPHVYYSLMRLMP